MQAQFLNGPISTRTGHFLFKESKVGCDLGVVQTQLEQRKVVCGVVVSNSTAGEEIHALMKISQRNKNNKQESEYNA